MNSPAAMPKKISHTVPESTDIETPLHPESRSNVETDEAAKPSVSIIYQPTGNASRVVINGKELTCPIDEVDIELNPDGSGRVILGIFAKKVSVKEAVGKRRKQR